MDVTYFSPEEVWLNMELHKHLPEYAEAGSHALVVATEERGGEKAAAWVVFSQAMLEDVDDPRAVIESSLRDALDRVWDEHDL